MSGFFKSLEKSVNNFTRDVTREVGHVTRDINREVDKVWASPALDKFKTGNVVQLVSRSSGRCLQIVMSPTGQLVLDGQGPEGPQMFHAHWTVVDEGKNVVRLHNNFNYLAIVNGSTVIGMFPPETTPFPETRFQLGAVGDFIVLESIMEKGRHIGILANGEMKSALATGREIDAQFAPKLIYSPHPQAVAKK